MEQLMCFGTFHNCNSVSMVHLDLTQQRKSCGYYPQESVNKIKSDGKHRGCTMGKQSWEHHKAITE